MAAGPVAQVLSSARGVGLLVRLGDLERGRAVLAAASIQAAPDGEVLRVALPPEEAATVTKALVAEGLYLTE